MAPVVHVARLVLAAWVLDLAFALECSVSIQHLVPSAVFPECFEAALD